MQVEKYKVLYKTKNASFLTAASDPQDKSSIWSSRPPILTSNEITLTA